jgi:hypothetical protein
MASQFEAALKFVVEERVQFVKAMKDRVASNRDILMQRIEHHVEEETTAQRKYASEFKKVNTIQQS